jgi:hypothetical protein
MTKDEIVKLEAGVFLDALVGEHVMGLPPGAWALPFYSTDIAAAWQVVEKMRSKDPFNAGARFAEELAQMTDANQDDYMADAFNLIMNLSPLAICRAALLAVMDSRP